MMLPPEALYAALVPLPTPEVVDDDGGPPGPVLIIALDGFVDGGAGVRLLREHVLATCDAERIIAFDADLLVDYRSRRPAMTFSDRAFTEYAAPELAIWRLRDQAGVPFLLLAGPEPDLFWERFITAVLGVSRSLRVRLSVGVTAVPWAAPHTRPVGVIAHSPQAERVAGYDSMGATVQVPGHMTALLEYRLGLAEAPAIGFAAQVPHYLAHLAYPEVALRLLDAVSGATGLSLPIGELTVAAEAVRADVDAQVEGAPESQAMVAALEAQFDAVLRARSGEGSGDDESALPSADDIAAQFERFLAERDRGRDQG